MTSSQLLAVAAATLRKIGGTLVQVSSIYYNLLWLSWLAIIWSQAGLGYHRRFFLMRCKLALLYPTSTTDTVFSCM